MDGRLQTRKYTDEDGIERYATGIIAENMQVLGGCQGAGGGNGADAYGEYDTYGAASSRPAPRQTRPALVAGPQPKPAQNFSNLDDDIPF